MCVLGQTYRIYRCLSTAVGTSRSISPINLYSMSASEARRPCGIPEAYNARIPTKRQIQMNKKTDTHTCRNSGIFCLSYTRKIRTVLSVLTDFILFIFSRVFINTSIQIYSINLKYKLDFLMDCAKTIQNVP